MCSAFKQIVITVQRSNWSKNKQSRLHGNPVADIFAGAEMQKPLKIKKCDKLTNGPTNMVRCRVVCPRLIN